MPTAPCAALATIRAIAPDAPIAPSIGYRPGLDGVRALAVTAVILYHGDVSWARGGFLGVDVFFVLSGFLITSLLLAEHASSGGLDLARFWARRARRLLPALFAVLLAVALYAAVWAQPSELGRIRGDGIASLLYVSNWRFVLDGSSYFSLFRAPSPLAHTWSLAIEEQWYLLWPLALLALLRVFRARLHLVAATCGGLAVGSAVLMAVLFRPGADPSRVVLRHRHSRASAPARRHVGGAHRRRLPARAARAVRSRLALDRRRRRCVRPRVHGRADRRAERVALPRRLLRRGARCRGPRRRSRDGRCRRASARHASAGRDRRNLLRPLPLALAGRRGARRVAHRSRRRRAAPPARRRDAGHRGALLPVGGGADQERRTVGADPAHSRRSAASGRARARGKRRSRPHDLDAGRGVGAEPGAARRGAGPAACRGGSREGARADARRLADADALVLRQRRVHGVRAAIRGCGRRRVRSALPRYAAGRAVPEPRADVASRDPQLRSRPLGRARRRVRDIGLHRWRSPLPARHP